jgi:hypothetical protein
VFSSWRHPHHFRWLVCFVPCCPLEWNAMPSSQMWQRQFLFAWRIPSSSMLRHEALVRTDVSEEHITSIIRVTRIGELGKLLLLY